MNQRGALVPLRVLPRKCAKKDIYVIGGSKRELNSVWDRGLEIDYVAIEKFDTFTRYAPIYLPLRESYQNRILITQMRALCIKVTISNDALI